MKNKLGALILASGIFALSGSVQAAQAAPAYIGIIEKAGNPQNRLTIISAYSCQFCRIFEKDSTPEIQEKWKRKGFLIETIPVSIGPTDFAASIVATCGDPKGFSRRNTMLFRAQPEIMANWNGLDDKTKSRLRSSPKSKTTYEIAQKAGIISLSESLGLKKVEVEACLRDDKKIRIQSTREDFVNKNWNIVGTPTVFINGNKAGSTWTEVRKKLENVK
jgi:hypothetical protein